MAKSSPDAILEEMRETYRGCEPLLDGGSIFGVVVSLLTHRWAHPGASNLTAEIQA